MRLPALFIERHSKRGEWPHCGPVALDHVTDVKGIAPAIVVSAEDRLVPEIPRSGSWIAAIAFLSMSIFAHAAFYPAFVRSPLPLASVGELSISVEIVLGSERTTGLAPLPTEIESIDSAALNPSHAARSAERTPNPEKLRLSVQDQTNVDESKATSPVPQRTPEIINATSLLERQTPDETKISDKSTHDGVPEVNIKVAESKRANDDQPEEVKLPEEEVARGPASQKMDDSHIAELTAEPLKSLSGNSEVKLETAIAPSGVLPSLESGRPEKPQKEPLQQAEQVSPEAGSKPDRPASAPSSAAVASIPSTSSSGIGRGRSDSYSNYRGVVSAHLSRHKRFPETARHRREQGSAVVTFVIDGSGKVTTVSLARSSGSTRIDEAALEIVRRASPFPAPPGAQTITFNVPMTFEVR